VREVGYGLSLEGASSAALVESKQAESEPVVQRRKSGLKRKPKAKSMTRSIALSGASTGTSMTAVEGSEEAQDFPRGLLSSKLSETCFFLNSLRRGNFAV